MAIAEKKLKSLVARHPFLGLHSLNFSDRCFCVSIPIQFKSIYFFPSIFKCVNVYSLRLFTGHLNERNESRCTQCRFIATRFFTSRTIFASCPPEYGGQCTGAAATVATTTTSIGSIHIATIITARTFRSTIL